MSDDPWKDETAVVWARQVLDDMVPKLRDSACAISLYPSDGSTGDVKYWVELGASICMNKPILLVVMGDAELPPKLAQVADEIVRLRNGLDAEGSGLLGATAADFLRRFPE